MIEVVGVFERVGEHEARRGFAVDVDHTVEVLLVQLERIIAAVKEIDFGPEQLGGALRLILAAGLHAFQGRALFLPGELTLAALAEGQADNLHPVTVLGVQRDCAAGAPDEIARMGGDDKACFLIRHGRLTPVRKRLIAAARGGVDGLPRQADEAREMLAHRAPRGKPTGLNPAHPR